MRKIKELQNVNAQIGEKSAQAKAYEDDIKAQEAKIVQMEAEIKKKEAEEAAKKRQRKLPEKPPQRERRIIRPRKGILEVRLPLRREVLRCAGRALQADALHLDSETVNHRRRARPRTIRALISALRPAAASWQPPENGFDCNLQLFGWKLCRDQPWKWTFNRVYALFQLRYRQDTVKSRTDDREGRFDRIFDRFSSAFCSPQERKLCKPFGLCKSVVRKVSGGCKR